MSSVAKSIALIVLSITIAVGGQFCLKSGMTQVGQVSGSSLSTLVSFFLKAVRNPLVLLGLFLYGLSAVVWLIVLSRVDLSFAYPMIGLSYVVVLLVSSLFLKEDVSALRWVGAVIILVGVVLISRT